MQRFSSLGFCWWATLLLGCEHRKTTAPMTPDQQQEDRRQVTATLEARAAAKELRTYYPLVKDSGYEQGMQCPSQAKGYDELHACLVIAWEKSCKSQGKMPLRPRATSPCAQEIERGHRAQLDAQPQLLRSKLTWLEGQRKKLIGPLKGTTLAALCRADAGRCASEPAAPPLEQAASPANLTACTQQLFICGSEGADCLVDGVARGLGLDPDNTLDGPLLVRATQRPL